MIQHICISYKCISFVAINLYSEDSRRDHHPIFRVFFERELNVLGDFFANQLVVSLNILNFLSDHILEGRAIEELSFFYSEEDRKVCEAFRQDVNKLDELRIWASFFLHDECSEKGVFGRNQSLSKLTSCH